jgi:hypothetical protein
VANSITEAIPKSTWAIAMLLWTVLFTIMAWTLAEAVESGKQLAKMAADRDNDMMSLQEIREDVVDHETRIRTLERPPPAAVRR